MMSLDLGAHAGFIIASYAIFAAVLAGLVAWVVADGAALTATLSELDARGIRRRSADGPPAAKDAE